MKYAAYHEYQPSGEDWLGEVPAHWTVKAIKWESPVLRGASPRPIDDPIYFDDEGEYAWVRISDVTEAGTYLENTEQKLSDVGARLSVKLKPGDLFLSIAGSVGKPCITRIKCCIHDGFVYFPKWKADPKFLYYLFASGEPYKGLGKMGTQLNLNTDTVGSIVIGLPDADEQQTITRFLDAKTAQIDALVAQKRQLIAKLKEKCSALITRTVTRGLPPEAAKAAGLEPHPEMKDSGVEWLGAVPLHWDVVRVKFVAKVESGHTPSRAEPSYWIEEECIIPWVSLNDSKFLKENDFISETAVKISEEGMRNSSAHLLPAGAVVFTRDATIGLTAITTVPAAVSQHVIAWLPGERVFAKYLLLVFKVMQNYLDSLTFGSTLKTIGMSDIRRIAMPIPSLDEQQAIVKYLDFEISQIHGMTDKIELAIARLTEYRQALITSAVTGKIDVRRFDQRTES
jgi:type I restriction enzyme S subunit